MNLFLFSINFLSVLQGIRAFSNEDLIALHANLLSAEEMDDLKRELRNVQSNENGRRHHSSNTVNTSSGNNQNHRNLRSSAHNHGLPRPTTTDSDGMMKEDNMMMNDMDRYGEWGECTDGSEGKAHGNMSGEEHCVIMHLFSNRDYIDRILTEIHEGDEFVGMKTTTTSAIPDVAYNIQAHVAQMRANIERNNVIRPWDPLFASVFEHRKEIIATVEYIHDGVSFEQKGTTACGAALIKEHSLTVSHFLENGMPEAHAEHEVPSVCQL